MSALLSAINAARAQARVCTAGGSTLPAVAALAWNAQLAAAADRHSADMAGNNFFSHTGSDGSTFDQRITQAGYRWTSAGENIAAGYSSVVDVVQGWLGSPGHCVNIMSASYTEFGASCRYSAASQYKSYWTTDFGRR
ncbi:MAG: CAP domain-containing protein [Burkholderiales bacterium]|uniref:CAP domain-containing protein n=1 Tax=Ottowia sp. TaxID=1898956 RepID=UPI001AD477D0|nr:CAP domain-containing protein [Ottowia sp.]MBN9405904.1 CAP domain-containing protein [Burkholderiales bacterium]MBS0403399.1 CAP domain-containing protein [Pseudomonadota bacterium]MBS0414225.1 CAP domain-containing protein [Pseudomonadota bacterium]